jgi:GGDEF domain-containing protein
MNYQPRIQKGDLKIMSAESSIILLTNDDNITQILKPKLVLLRDIDNILTTNYINAIEILRKNRPDTILLYCADEKEDCINLIKAIHSNKLTKNATILLIVKDYDQDFVLSAYDENITDYLVLKADDDAEILMRTIWALKKKALATTVRKQYNLLEELTVINKETGFYSNKFCEKVFETEFQALKETATEGILMMVSPTEESKTEITQTQLAQAIKKSTRNSDVLAHGPLNRFYILLHKTNLQGAFCVWDKIKKSIGEERSIVCGVADVENKTFTELKNDLLNALIEAESTKNDLIIVDNREENSSEDWLDKINSTQKNFKLFKQAFNKKLDKVITPVFFQVQKLYEEKLFKTQIEQYSNSSLSSFSLKKANKESELKITYPGFSKINVDIVHQGLDSPENKHISLDLAELDETKLTKILEAFIQEFKSFAD